MNLSEQFTEKEIGRMKDFLRGKKIQFWLFLFTFLLTMPFAIYLLYQAYKYGVLPLAIPGQLLDKIDDPETQLKKAEAFGVLYWPGFFMLVVSVFSLTECFRAKKTNLQTKCYGMIVAMLEEQEKESCENTGDTGRGST